MDGKISSGENRPNLLRDMDELAKELDSMSVEELREEFEILWSEMDEDSFDGELLEVYLDAIDRKSPQAQHMDTRTAYKQFLKLLKERERKGARRRSFRGVLKVGVIAAAIVALLAASVVIANAAGLFDRIARWTAETFGFASADTSDKAGAEIPPQLQGMKEALIEAGISGDYLPRYWPTGYEQSQIIPTGDPEVIDVSGAFEKDGNYIILSYIYFLSGKPEVSYNIDEEKYDPYIHNNIKFYVMTNEGGYLAVWYQGSVEGSISGVTSYGELTKILDSIGG